ncbi:MAG: hypothetical protein AB7F98_09245 [Novosphingobium sp.]
MISRSQTFSLTLCLLAMAGCKGEAPPPTAESATPSAAASASETASAAPGQAACAPVKLELAASRFSEGRANFEAGKAGRTRLEENFAKGYAAACSAGYLAKKPLVDPRSGHKDTLFVANAPNANEASIYFAVGETMMEGPFVDSEGHVQVPGADAIKEAIYCYAVGATEKEQEESGRCLVD